MADQKPVATNPATATPATKPEVDPKTGKPVEVKSTPTAGKADAQPSATKEGTTVPLPELMEERQKRQEQEKLNESLRAELEAMKKVAPAPVTTTPQQDWQKQVEQLWETDPRKAVQAEIMAAVTWYDSVAANIDAQEHNLSSKYTDYNNYRNEVRKYVRSLPIEQRMKEGIVELAYYAVKGQKVDSTMEEIRKKMEQEILDKINRGELTSTPAGTVTTPPTTPTYQVTDEEKKVAAVMFPYDPPELALQKYMEGKKGGGK